MTVPTTDTIMREVKAIRPDGSYVVAKVGLEYLNGNRAAYWAATGEVYEPRRNASGQTRHRQGRDPDLSGAIGDEIARVFPKLAGIAALHLSDPDGVPMHAEANGWYFYTGEAERYEREHYGDTYAERNGTGRERTARTLRVDVADLPEDMDRDEFTDYVNAQRDRWRAESEAAYALLLTL